MEVLEEAVHCIELGRRPAVPGLCSGLEMQNSWVAVGLSKII